MAVPAALKRLAAARLLAPVLAEGLVYWRSQQLYWEGVTHPEGGEREEQAEIHAAEGAQTAVRRLADHAGVTELMPGEDCTHALGLKWLREGLEADERAALKTLDRLGPSRLIDVSKRIHDYMEAADAEMLLDRLDRVHDYLDWLPRTTRDATAGSMDDVDGARA